jgi:hypothetical protein
MKNLLKTLWILCSTSILAVTLAQYESGPKSDIGVFLVYGMLALAFPSSLLVAALIALLVLTQDMFGIEILDLIGSNHIGIVGMWLAFVAAGYAQWFHLFPWLRRKWNSRHVRAKQHID